MTNDDAPRSLEPVADRGTGALAVGAFLAGIAIGGSGPLLHVALVPGLVTGPSVGGIVVVAAVLLGAVATLAVLVALAAGHRPYLGVATVVASVSIVAGSLVGGNLGSTAGVGGWGTEAAATPSPTPLTEPGWSITGTMREARARHTATLPADGRVLVAGGSGEEGRGLASAELFDPGAGAWTATGAMTSSPSQQRALLLRDGRVLVLDDARGTVDAYDPATGTWSPGAPMPGGRAFYAATVLADGRVLVAGGRGANDQPVADTLVYDPVGDAWAAGRPMSTARAGHSATLLADGRVLVAGGFGPAVLKSFAEGAFPVEPQLASAELCDPRTGRWQPTGSMAVARTMHAATRLADGSVFVAEGDLGLEPQHGAVEIYASRTGTWHLGGALTQSLVGGAIASLLPDGRVLLAHAMGGPLEIYDPATQTSTAVVDAHRTTSGSSATVLADGRVLLTGGTLLWSNGGWGISSKVIDAAHLYDPGG